MNFAQLPEGYSVRAATMDDADAATDLLNACEIAENGEPDFGPGELAADWADIGLGERVALIEAPDGSLAGYLALSSRGNVVHDADIYVHPDHTGRGLGTYLIRLSEARALSWVDSAPAGKRVVLRNPVNGVNPQANELLQNLGYEKIRHFWRMEIQMDAEPPEPTLPEGFTIRTCREGQDERAIFEAGREAYRDHWNMGPTTFDEWLNRKHGDKYDPSLWFQLLDGEEIAGVAVCKVFSEDMGWVGDLCVRRPWRKRGFGSALLQHAFREFYRRGFRRVGLGVDSQNPTGATRLYERAGMKVTRKFVIYEKELRPGEPWEE
jgi:mycothiol synthase